MFESILKFFKRIGKAESREESSNTAKERLHLVLMQDRANVSADFLDMMKQEIIEVIKKYIDVDENAIDVRLTNKTNEDGTNGAPALYANIPIISIKEKELEKEAKEQEKKTKNPKPKEETKKPEDPEKAEKIIQPEKEQKLLEGEEIKQDKKQLKKEEKDIQQQTSQTEIPRQETEEKQRKQTKQKSTKAKI